MGFGGSPKPPKVPDLPPPPPPPPQLTDPAIADARKANQSAAARSGNRSSTVLTTGQGLTLETANTTKKKQLLGT